MYRNKKTSLILAVVFICLLSVSAGGAVYGASHQEDYVPLSPLPGTGESVDVSDPGSYFAQMFATTIGVAAVLAVIVLMISGFQYMTSEAISSKQAAKEKIWAVMLGLGIMLTSWLLLVTINPDLVSLRFFDSFKERDFSRQALDSNTSTSDTSSLSGGLSSAQIAQALTNVQNSLFEVQAQAQSVSALNLESNPDSLLQNLVVEANALANGLVNDSDTITQFFAGILAMQIDADTTLSARGAAPNVTFYGLRIASAGTFTIGDIRRAAWQETISLYLNNTETGLQSAKSIFNAVRNAEKVLVASSGTSGTSVETAAQTAELEARFVELIKWARGVHSVQNLYARALFTAPQVAESQNGKGILSWLSSIPYLIPRVHARAECLKYAPASEGDVVCVLWGPGSCPTGAEGDCPQVTPTQTPSSPTTTINLLLMAVLLQAIETADGVILDLSEAQVQQRAHVLPLTNFLLGLDYSTLIALGIDADAFAADIGVSPSDLGSLSFVFVEDGGAGVGEPEPDVVSIDDPTIGQVIGALSMAVGVLSGSPLGIIGAIVNAECDGCMPTVGGVIDSALGTDEASFSDAFSTGTEEPGGGTESVDQTDDGGLSGDVGADAMGGDSGESGESGESGGSGY